MEDVNVTATTTSLAEGSADALVNTETTTSGEEKQQSVDNTQTSVNSSTSFTVVGQVQETVASNNTDDNPAEKLTTSTQNSHHDVTPQSNDSTKDTDVKETPSDSVQSNDTSATTGNQQSKAPTPSSFAGRTTAHGMTANSLYSATDIESAQSFGRADEQGTVFVKEGDTEREVGQFPDATAEEALNFYARRYLDLKARLDLFENRLAQPTIRPREIDQSLKTLSKEVEKPDVVGDISALNTQFSHLRELAEQKKQELAETRKAQIAQATQERTAIVENAEKLASNLDSHTNWRTTGEEFKKLFEQWQEHQKGSVRIDKNTAENLWTRFSTARASFNQARRKWLNERENSRNEARASKEAIIKEAEELQNSTDWVATSKKFNELMDRWRKVHRINRKEDDALWEKFRAAANTFYNARQEDRNKTNEDEQQNLKKKEDLVQKAECLLPVKTVEEAKRARKQLSAIQEEWDKIGFVPRQDRHRIESKLDAVERQIKTVEDSAWKQSDPEADARKNSFTLQLESQLAQLDEQIERCTDEKKKAKLLAEKATKEQWLNAVK